MRSSCGTGNGRRRRTYALSSSWCRTNHVPRLAGRSAHAVPRRVPRVDVLAPAEARLDLPLPEKPAGGRGVRSGGHAPDRVAGIDVLESDGRAGPFEVVGDRVAQEDAHVAVLDVPRCVPLLALR